MPDAPQYTPADLARLYRAYFAGEISVDDAASAIEEVFRNEEARRRARLETDPDAFKATADALIAELQSIDPSEPEEPNLGRQVPAGFAEALAKLEAAMNKRHSPGAAS